VKFGGVSVWSTAVIVKQTDGVVVAHEFRCNGKCQWNRRCWWGRIAAFRFAGHVLVQQRTMKTFAWSLQSITVNETMETADASSISRLVSSPRDDISKIDMLT